MAIMVGTGRKRGAGVVARHASSPSVSTGLAHLASGLLLLLLLLVLGRHSLLWPFGRDQGSYAYAAWAWLDGTTLYDGVLVYKPPSTVWLHALAQLGFGIQAWSLRAFDM